MPEPDTDVLSTGRARVVNLTKRLDQRLASAWYRLRQGLWFFPTVMTLGAGLLAIMMIRLDQGPLAGHDINSWWFFAGGAEGARGVLTAIAGTMMTVATTVFSITIVAMQLGSSQFSPRILRSFTADRGNQLVLGTFIATFAYTLLVLRRVQSASADREVFVPAASVTLAIVLALAAIGSLLYFFHHATRTIQASVVIDRAAHDTFRLLDAETSLPGGEIVTVPDTVARADMMPIAANRAGYLTSIDVEALAALAGEHHLVITVEPLVGTYMLSTSSLASLPRASVHGLPADRQGSVVADIRRGFHLEFERTLEHDVRLGFRQVSDIALRALSPGINDPTTAITCIDALGEALLRALTLPGGVAFIAGPDGEGGVRRRQLGFEDVVAECLPQIRHAAANDVVVVMRLLKVLEQVAAEAAAPAREVLTREAWDAVLEAEETLVLSTDRRRVREAGDWASRSPDARPGEG